jgi:DNA-binding NarL/FixJ family response regulator
MASHIAVAAIEFVQAGGRYYPHTPIRGQSAPTFQVAWSALSDADQTDVQPCSPEIEIESPSSSLGPHGGSESNEENHSELRFDWQALHLTPRQMDVLHSLERGLSNKTIGKELALSESTVKLHVRHLMRKLRVRNRTQIALLASAAQRGHDPS